MATARCTAGFHVPVLIADDEAVLRESMRMLLEDAGYPVREAGDGPTTLEALRTSPDPLVVLLDLVMPQHGHDLLDAIAADRGLATRHVYIICTARLAKGGELLAADAARVGLMLARSSSPLRLVRKPFDIDALLAAVDEAACALGATVQPVEASGGAALAD